MPTKPTPTPTPASPPEVEATAMETITVAWRTLTFTLPAQADDWPLEATIAMEEGRAVVFVRALCPPADWSALMATRPRNRDFLELMDAVAKAYGLDLGE